MLHLAIIGIVCAFSAPSEGIAIIGRKNYESNGFYHADGGARPSSLSVYNVDAQNSSVDVTQEIAIRTNTSRCNYINKQYQNSRISSRGFMENVSSGETKELPNSNVVGIGFKKRNLFWIDENSLYSPKTLRPPLESPDVPMECKPKAKNFKCPKSKCERLIFRLKEIKEMICASPRDTNGLNHEQKKSFLRLKKMNKKIQKRTLEKLRIDDELDLNKRIQKLVEEIAMDNQRSANEAVPTMEYPIECSCEKSTQKKWKSFPIIKQIRKLFQFCKGSKKNNNNPEMCASSSVLQKSYQNTNDKAARITCHDLYKSMHKTRFRRDLNRSYKLNDHSYGEGLPTRSSPYSAHFKTKASYLYPVSKRRHQFNDNKKPVIIKYNYPKGPVRRPCRNIVRLRPLFRDHRWKRHCEHPRKLLKRSRTCSDAITKDPLQNVRRSRETAKIKEQMKIKSDDSKKLTEKSDQTLPKDSSTEDSALQQGRKKVKDVSTEPSLKKSLLKKYSESDSGNKKAQRCNLKGQEDSRDALTNCPAFDSDAVPDEPDFQNDFPERNALSMNRYLKIRHALRNYLVHSNILGSANIPSMKRNKRFCGDKCCCSMPHKCWRSPPLLCIPYIKKGQDDMLRYLVKLMQRMIGRPFPPKADIFDSTKYKPCSREDHPCGDDCSECPCMSVSVPPHQCVPLPCPPSSNCPCQLEDPVKFCHCALSKPCPLMPYQDLRPRLVPEIQQNYPFEVYRGSPYTAYLTNSPYPYGGRGNAEHLYRSTQNCCGCDECIPPSSSVCMPSLISSPYSQSSIPSPISSLSSSSYASTPLADVTPPAQELSLSTFARPSSGNPSTSNACSWYVSKSPVERAEYFSYTALPYNMLNQRATSSSQPLIPQQPAGADQLHPCSSCPEHSPGQTPFAVNLLPAQERPGAVQERPGEYHCRNKQKEPTSELANKLKKEENERKHFEWSENFGKGYHPDEGAVKCDNQEPRFSETQIPKPDMNYGNSKSRNTGNAAMPFKCRAQPVDMIYQQLPKAYTGSSYAKSLSKENPQDSSKIDIPQVVSNALDQSFPPEANLMHYNRKIPNSQESFRCAHDERFSIDEQLPKPVCPEVQQTIKYGKNVNKNNAYACSLPHTLNEHLPKAVIDDDVDDRRFFKTKHHKSLLKNLRKPAIGLLQAYDDYYDKYPQYEAGEETSFGYNRAPFLRTWKGYSKKIKKSPKGNALVRRKRNDNYYTLPESSENYGEYESDFNDSDELSDDSSSSDEAPLDPNWTPPSYQMLSELAKAVTTFDNRSSESVSNFSDNAISTVASVGDIAEKIDQDIKKKCTLGGNVVVSSVSTNDTTSEPSQNFPERTNDNTATANASTDTTTAESADNNPGTDTSEGDKEGEENLDSKKSGKTSFFQTNSKSMAIQSNSGRVSTTKKSNSSSGKEVKEPDENEDSEGAEESQVPTTLKTASIVKGPKKQLTKPNPKVYAKVYPDSVGTDAESNGTTTTTAATTVKAAIEKATQAPGSSSNIQLQLLAVCEGYLEVVKLIKAQNLTLAEELDADLARYCENIISQNFNLQSDSSKPRKQEWVSTSTSKPIQSSPKAKAGFHSTDSCSDSGQRHEIAEPRLVALDTRSNPVFKRELDNIKRYKKNLKKKKKYKWKNEEHKDVIDEEFENFSLKKRSKSIGRRNRKTHFHHSTERGQRKVKRYRRKEETDDESLQKVIAKEQKELLNLLKKRKKALLSRLYKSKMSSARSMEPKETEYFDDEDYVVPGSDVSSYSGTIAPKEYKETSKVKGIEWIFPNESIFPVYAKRYGYDKGGELTEVEVLWRRVNKKTHEKQIFKNLSVLALLLDSTDGPKFSSEDSHGLRSGFDSEEMSETQSKSEGKEGLAEVATSPRKKTSTSSTATKVKGCGFPNNTHTFVSKPDPQWIVGEPPNATAPCRNVTRKVSHKFDAAKGLFQEYSIEFLNYAVYILPAMFTVLFVLCCLCCAMQILKSSTVIKKHKRKKKIILTTDSETTEESEVEAKKKCREARRKKHAKNGGEYETLDKKRTRAFWDYLRRNSCKSKTEFNGGCPTEKKRSFLRFLKVRKNQGSAGCSSHCAAVREDDEHRDVEAHRSSDAECRDERRKQDENPKSYCQSEAEERRDLIALLEELKKIETENSGEKKEVKSVHVQYVTQEDDAPVFQHSEFAFPYHTQKNVFGMPKGCSPCRKHFNFYQPDPPPELFEDVNELTELLPRDSNYYSNRNDYLGRCDFEINQEAGCKKFIKIFHDAGVTHTPFRERNLFKNESENHSFIYNKYRRINTDMSGELMTQKIARTEVPKAQGVCEKTSPLRLEPAKEKENGDRREETDNLKRQLSSKKHVRLKDNGVLCRL